VYAFGCRGILVGETFSEKDFDHPFTRGDAVGRAGFARSGATDAGHRFQGCELASRAAPSQAEQEFAPCEASPRHEAAQPNAIIAGTKRGAQVARVPQKINSCAIQDAESRFAHNANFWRSKNWQPILKCKTGNQAAPRFAIFCFVVCGAGAMLPIMIGQVSRATRTACAV